MNLRVMSLALLLGATAYGGMSASALAADLGGDCCADLEERVAELEATTARKGNRKVSVELYGHVTTALMYWNNGDRHDTYIVDNSNSTSRFGIQGSAKISPTLSAGFRLEIGTISAPAGSVTVTDDDGGASQTGDGSLALRQAHWYLAHTKYGKLSVGRVSMATDGISEIDLGGTAIVTLSGLNVGNKILIGGTATTWDQVAPNNFEFDRNNAVRYDSATVGGFMLSAAAGENDRWDVTLRYAGEIRGFRLAAGIGYGVGSDNSDKALVPVPLDATFDRARFIIGSASALHVGTGLFLSGMGGQRTTELTTGTEYDETFWAVRAGIAKNFFGLGNTVLYGEYNTWDNGQNLGRTAEIYGAGIVQNIDAAAMELFLSYRHQTVDIPGAEDTDIVLSGARIKF